MSAPTTVTSAPASLDSFNCKRTLTVDGQEYVYYSLPEAEKNGLTGISKLPYAMKVLLENLLRHEDGRSVTKADIVGAAEWIDNKGRAEREIGFRPARVDRGAAAGLECRHVPIQDRRRPPGQGHGPRQRHQERRPALHRGLPPRRRAGHPT